MPRGINYTAKDKAAVKVANDLAGASATARELGVHHTTVLEHAKADSPEIREEIKAIAVPAALKLEAFITRALDAFMADLDSAKGQLKLQDLLEKIPTYLDKLQLLSGQPTSIVQQQTVATPEDLQKMREAIVQKARERMSLVK